MQRNIGAKTGGNVNCPGAARIVVQPDQQVRTAKPFIGKDVEIFPSLLRRPICDFFMDPNQVIDERFQAETIRIGAVVPVINAGVTLGSENQGVSKDLVDDDRAQFRMQIGIMIFHKGYGLERGRPDQPGVIETRHVKAAGVIAHCADLKLEREIKGAGSPVHTAGVEYPASHKIGVPIKEFTDREFPRQRRAVEIARQKIG